MSGTKQTIKNNICLYRDAIGLTQNDLALRTSIPAPTLYRYEKGEVRISEQNKKSIANALDKKVDEVFPASSMDNGINRRQFLGNVAVTGAGLAMAGLSPILIGNPSFQGGRTDPSKDEINILAEDNYALWELLNALQRGASINFVYSIAQGKMVVLKHLSECSLLPNQKALI